MKIAKKGYKKEIEMDTKNILKEKKIKRECKKEINIEISENQFV